MDRTVRRGIATLLSLSLAGVLVATGFATEVPRMSKEELKSRLGSSDVIVLDVRGSWNMGGGGGETRIAGAIREDPGEVGAWAGKYPKDKTIVLYCA